MTRTQLRATGLPDPQSSWKCEGIKTGFGLLIEICADFDPASAFCSLCSPNSEVTPPGIALSMLSKDYAIQKIVGRYFGRPILLGGRM